MYYDVYINEKKVATIGPLDLEHMGVSVSGGEGDSYLFADGFAKKGKEDYQTHFTWLEQDLNANDIVRIVPSQASKASPPLRTRKLLRRGQKATKQNRYCDFCKLGEEETGKLIQTGDSPFICVHCAELCLEIAKGGEDKS
jgi:hypothetical protein